MIFEMHTHTRFGSSCSYMTPEDMVQQAVNVGLDGICITEHDIPWDPDDVQKLSDRFGILVIGGIEVSTELGEVLVWGYHEPVFDIEGIQDLRTRVDGAGGIMAAAHPFRGSFEYVTVEKKGRVNLMIDEASHGDVFKWVDAMEVFNGRAPDWEIKLSRIVCDKLRLKGIGGSDAHNISSVGDCVTVFHNPIRNESEFIEELKAGRFYARHRRLSLDYPASDIPEKLDG